MRLFLAFERLRRGMTLGVRAVVLDDQNRVLLVKHTYIGGWHFPGGGVEPRETLAQALVRELEEEGGIALTGGASLLGIYLNQRHSQRDHVAVFVCREWRRSRDTSPNWEIADTRFFSSDALPADATAGTRARLAEILDGVPPSPDW